jgi:hypothetical protein
MTPLGFGSAGFSIDATVLIETVTLADPNMRARLARRFHQAHSR